MTDYFFYGTLRHEPLLQVVLGRVPDAAPAELPDYHVYWAEGQSFPVLAAKPGSVARGLKATGLSAQDIARLDFYEGGFAYATQVVQVRVDGDTADARVYLPKPGIWLPGADWSLEDWAGKWAETVTEAARDFMALFGQKDPSAVLARYPQMLVRAGARIRARRTKPTTLRRRADNQDVFQTAYRQPYASFFAVEEYDLAFRHFDGGMSQPVTREAFVSGDAAVVLPYDPVRDRVLLIEQFRFGPFARGDSQAWSIEAIAGRVDGGETPEDAARREAIEEAGLTLRRLVPGPSYYPSPASKTEYLYSFVGIADLPDGVTGLHGMADEAEDIRSHLVNFDKLMELVQTGEADNAPLVLIALWLARQRDGLRGAAVGSA